MSDQVLDMDSAAKRKAALRWIFTTFAVSDLKKEQCCLFSQNCRDFGLWQGQRVGWRALFFLLRWCSQSPHGWRLAYVWQPSACSCVLRGLRNDLAHKNDGHKLVWSLIFPTGFWPAAAASEPFGCYGSRR